LSVRPSHTLRVYINLCRTWAQYTSPHTFTGMLVERWRMPSTGLGSPTSQLSKLRSHEKKSRAVATRIAPSQLCVAGRTRIRAATASSTGSPNSATRLQTRARPFSDAELLDSDAMAPVQTWEVAGRGCLLQISVEDADVPWEALGFGTTSTTNRETYAAAMLHNRNEEYMLARRAFTRCLHNDPQFARAWVSYAQMEKRLGYRKRGRKLLQMGLRSSPRSPVLLQAWGLHELQEGNGLMAYGLLSSRCVLLNQVTAAVLC